MIKAIIRLIEILDHKINIWLLERTIETMSALRDGSPQFSADLIELRERKSRLNELTKK